MNPGLHQIDWGLLRELVDRVGKSDPEEERNYIPQAVRAQVKERDGSRCNVCGRSVEDLHLHHRDPYAESTPENLLSLCRPCHQVVHCLLFVSGKHRFVNVLSGPRYGRDRRWV